VETRCSGITWLSRRFVTWSIGLAIYFCANMFYTVALTLAPASLCASMVATVVPLNALMSWALLGEVLDSVDFKGGILIMLGIIVAAYAAPYTTYQYTAQELQPLLLSVQSLGFLAGIFCVITLLGILVLHFEHQSAQPDHARQQQPAAFMQHLRTCAPFLYPVIVGLLESVVQLAQKSGSGMLALTLVGDSQLNDPVFAIVCTAWTGSSLFVIWWLRKSLTVLPASRLLPIEYGTFTASSVLGGLLVFDEQRVVTSGHLWLMALGSILVIVGCIVLGSRQSIVTSGAPNGLSEDRTMALRQQLLTDIRTHK
jgi:hypothetical protein